MNNKEKNEITEEDVIKEFGAIKNGSNNGLVFLIIILLIVIGGLVYVVIKDDKIVLNHQEKCQKVPEINEEPDIDNSKENITKLDQVLNTDVGKFIIDTEENSYFIPNEKITLLGVELTLGTELSGLGIKGMYNINSIQTEAYKLDLMNASSAYELYFGNGNVSDSIIILTSDGAVNELYFNVADNTKTTLNVKTYKNVGKYTNIVSVVKNASASANGAILIDKDGNEYSYVNENK